MDAPTARHSRTPSPTGDGVVERIPYESGGSATVAIVRAVAEAEDVTPGQLPQLSDVIDPEGVDAVFDAEGHVGRNGATLSFDYCGYHVTVTDDLVTLE